MPIKISTENTVKNSTLNIEVISITEEKLKNILTDHIKKLQKSKDLISSISLFATLIGVLLTADFRIDGVNQDTVYGVLLVITILSFVYVIYVIWNCYKHRDDVDNIMRDIKTYSSIANLDVIVNKPKRRKKK